MHHLYTAFYLSTGHNRGVESDIREKCYVFACYTLCFSLDIVILLWEREADGDGHGFKVDSASMPVVRSSQDSSQSDPTARIHWPSPKDPPQSRDSDGHPRSAEIPKRVEHNFAENFR
jgi:hypothetical protein